MSIPAYAPTPLPVNTRGITNVLYIADYATVPGDLALRVPSNVAEGVGSIVRKPVNTNGHTLYIEDNNIGGGTFTIDGMVITADNIGETILIKNEALGYGQAINVPEVFIAAGDTPTAATPFPPNVPGLPGGFPAINPLNAVAAPPAIADYDPTLNPTGGVWPYNYWQGHPFRDDTVVEINESSFGIYEIIDVQTFVDPGIMDYIILTRTKESLGIVPGSIVYIKTGTLNASKEFIFESNDEFFNLGFSGLRNGISYTQTGLNIILTGDAAGNVAGTTLNGAGTLFLSQLKIGDTITVDPDPGPGGYAVTEVVSNTVVEVAPAFAGAVVLGAELRITSGEQSVTANYQLLNASVSNTQPADPDDQITSGVDIFTFGGTARDLDVGDKIFILDVGDAGVPTNVFTISAIASPTVATLDADITATVSVPRQQIYKFISSSVITGRFTTFAADFDDGKFIIGDTFQIDTGVDQEDLIISGVISNTQLAVQTDPTGDTHVCVPGNIVGSSDIFINTFIADTADPLIIDNLEVEGTAEICNIEVDSANCLAGTASVSILAGAGAATTTFTIGPGVSVVGLSAAFMNPFFTETFCSNVQQTFQITNWVTGAFDASGAAVAPPGPAGYPNAAGPPPPLEIFSQDPTNTITFSGSSAVAPYFLVPSNNLVGIATITIDTGGSITTTSVIGDGASDLIIDGNGFDIDFNGDIIKNVSRLELTGATPSIDTDAAVTLTFGNTNATDFNFSDKDIDIGGATGSILTDNIAGSTGAVIDFTANSLINISSLTATTVNCTTVQNTAGSLTVQSTTAGVTITGSGGDVVITAIGAGSTVDLVTTGDDITLHPGVGGEIDVTSETTNFTSGTLNLTTTTFVGYPQIVAMAAFDGTTPAIVSAAPVGFIAIARIGGVPTGGYTLTTGALGMANTTHMVHINPSDATTAAAGFPALTGSARVSTGTTIEAFLRDTTGAAVDTDLFFVSVWRI